MFNTTFSPTRVYIGRVLKVDRVNWTIDAIGQNNEMLFDIPIMPLYIGREGNGIFYLPEVDSTILLCQTTEGDVPFVLGGASVPFDNEEESDTESPAPNYRQNRPVLNQGDVMMSAPGGNFLVLRRGGVLELGASQIARRFYVPLQNMIRDFCSNYEMHTSGGKYEWKARKGDSSHGEGRTPVEIRMSVKEFAEEAPVIDFRLGRIERETAPLTTSKTKNSTVASLIINGNLQVYMDRDGNIDFHTKGNTVNVVEGCRVERTTGSRLVKTQGSFTNINGGSLVKSNGNRITEITKSDTLKVAKSQTLFIGGEQASEIGSKNASVKADDKAIVGGTYSRSAGLVEVVSSGDFRMGATGNYVETVTGSYQVDVGGSVSSSALDIRLLAGDMRLFSVAGKSRISSGGTLSNPVNKVEATLSSALMSSSNGASTVEVNTSGACLEANRKMISIDSFGKVNIGGSSGGKGNGRVVTTTTHPVCFVTGLPIKGSSTVTATGAPTIGPSTAGNSFSKA